MARPSESKPPPPLCPECGSSRQRPIGLATVRVGSIASGLVTVTAPLRCLDCAHEWNRPVRIHYPFPMERGAERETGSQ